MKKLKTRYKILIGMITITLIGFAALSIMFRPLAKDEIIDSIQSELEKTIEKNPELSSIVLQLYSDKKSFDHTFFAGHSDSVSSIDNPGSIRFHSASVGKTFTSTIISMLHDEGKLNYDDKIIYYLDESTLKNLFVYNNKDYSNDVTIKQLLNHTSGIGDYFGDTVSNGSTMIELLMNEPEFIWTPMNLIDFTRNNQKAVGAPGEKMHYSDTGYILLGLIIEKVENKEFHKSLHERIFNPLKMDDSYLMMKSEPKNNQNDDILEIWHDKKNIVSYNSISLDWSGGGIVTTTNDLLTFFKSLNQGKLVSKDSLKIMKTFENEYEKGIYYGLGMMKFEFKELSFLLYNMPPIYGGVGSTGCYMMYDEVNDTYIIANFGSIGFVEKGVETLVNVLMTYDRME